MKKDRKNLYFVVVVILVALGVFGTVFVEALWYAPDSEVEIPAAFTAQEKNLSDDSEKKPAKKVEAGKEKAVIAGYPVRLVIPALQIDAKVQKVGINLKGNMATPTNFKDVGWYKYGAVPGESGSAVIAGHVDNGLAFAGVFKKIGDLQKGDEVYVDTNDGRRLNFVVTGTEIYDYDAFVPEVFTQNDGRYLKLITCTGIWVASNRTHNKRLVVTAVRSTN